MKEGFASIAQELGIEPTRSEVIVGPGDINITTWQLAQRTKHSIVPVVVTESAHGDPSANVSVTSYDVPLFHITELPDEEAEKNFLLELLQLNRKVNFFGIGVSPDPVPEKQIDMSYTMRTDMPRSVHRGILTLALRVHALAVPMVEDSAVAAHVSLKPIVPGK